MSLLRKGWRAVRALVARKGRETEPRPDRVGFECPGPRYRDDAQSSCPGEARQNSRRDSQTAEGKERRHELDDHEDRHDDEGLTEGVEPSSVDLRPRREITPGKGRHECERGRDRTGIDEADELQKARRRPAAAVDEPHHE